MKGSDSVEMKINIGGELIKLNVAFDDQNIIRDTERAIKTFLDRKRKEWPEDSDRRLMALALYEFARSYLTLYEIQTDALELISSTRNMIEETEKNVSNVSS